MQVELPPVQMVGVEAEVVVLSTVTGVGQNVAATFGEAQEDVPTGRETFCCQPRGETCQAQHLMKMKDFNIVWCEPAGLKLHL